jgi:peroxiredoxin Q/BCP
MVELHKQAPEFSLQDQNGVTHTLEMHKGKKVVLYFYPKDDTPGCTVEACSFRDAYNDLQNKNVVVFGISKDSVKSHDKFAKKYELPFPLLSDSDGSICEAYGVWRKKKFMGREYMGIERMSFLIDEKGNIEKIYEKVKPKEHMDEVKGDVF